MNEMMGRLCDAVEIVCDHLGMPTSTEDQEAIVNALLITLREPTHQMMIAGDKAVETETDNPASWEAWRAMIDAASR